MDMQVSVSEPGDVVGVYTRVPRLGKRRAFFYKFFTNRVAPVANIKGVLASRVQLVHRTRWIFRLATTKN